MQNREISGVLAAVENNRFSSSHIKVSTVPTIAPYIHYLCRYLRSRNVKWISDIYQATSLWKLDRNG